jgi:large subunit ribosomal protein L18
VKLLNEKLVNQVNKNMKKVIKGTVERPRLSIFRSNAHIYAQIIDDTNATTLVSCSTVDPEIKTQIKKGNTCEASKLIGQILATRSVEKKITQVIFDRGRYMYHGRVKAVADGAREGGLEF